MLSGDIKVNGPPWVTATPWEDRQYPGVVWRQAAVTIGYAGTTRAYVGMPVWNASKLGMSNQVQMWQGCTGICVIGGKGQ